MTGAAGLRAQAKRLVAAARAFELAIAADDAALASEALAALERQRKRMAYAVKALERDAAKEAA